MLHCLKVFLGSCFKLQKFQGWQYICIISVGALSGWFPGPQRAGVWGFSHLPYGGSCLRSFILLPWSLYVSQTAKCEPGKLSDGSVHPVSVLLSITRNKVRLKREEQLSVFSSYRWGSQACCSEVTLPESPTRPLARLGIN